MPMWTYHGQKRPDFALAPGPDQESVWDYPRPPQLVSDARRVEVRSRAGLLASTTAAWRVLETASPPTFYLPRTDIDMAQLVTVPGRSMCEWKGVATYWALRADPAAGAVGWSYEDPTQPFAAIRGVLSFYPALVDCHVAGEHVRPQPGQFYGGWVTDDVLGPFKGEPDTGHW